VVQISANPSPALTLDELVRGVEYLPSAPRVLPRLKQLLRDGNSSMHEVVEMVRLDPGIAARVLQFGNSAYFSRGLRCYTVEEAVNRVGYEQIYELVATAVAAQVLVRPLETYTLDADELWHSSIACALAAGAPCRSTQSHSRAEAPSPWHRSRCCLPTRHCRQPGTCRSSYRSAATTPFQCASPATGQALRPLGSTPATVPRRLGRRAPWTPRRRARRR
jgi:hypothetical protein